MNKIGTFVVQIDIWCNEPMRLSCCYTPKRMEMLQFFIYFLRMKWLIMKLKTIFLVIHTKQELPYIKFFGLLHSFLSSFDRLIIHTKVGTETPLQVDIK